MDNRHTQNIRMLMARTGCGFNDCRKALIDCDSNLDMAYCLLKLLNQPICRHKKVGDKLVKWTREDYIQKAKENYKKGEKTCV